MTSWLKVAEDLLEVVDRRAKLVVSELSDEQQDSHPSSASNVKEVQARKTRTKKDKSRPSTEPPKSGDTDRDQTTTQTSASSVAADENVEPEPENAGALLSNSTTDQASAEPLSDVNKDIAVPGESLSENPSDNVSKNEANSPTKLSATDNHIEVVTPSVDGVVVVEKTYELPDKSSSQSTDSVDDSFDGHHPIPSDADTKVKFSDDNTLRIDQEGPASGKVEIQSHENGKEQDAEALQEPPPNVKKPEEHKTDSSPMRVQDQLDEAQGLLKSAVSTGQSKEARLARVCAGLSSRLQEYKAENAQLEELLVAERERCNSFEAHIKQLQQELSNSKTAVSKVESDMADALAAKNSEIETLVSSMEALKRQVAASEGQLASLQANMETITRSRELTETRMMQALHEELSAAERRADEERAAHNATKMAAMERQVELEHRAVEASTALARVQRTVDERTLKATELEQKVALLEVECASLNQELQDMEVRARRGQKRSPEEANQALQAWQDEVERARLGQRDAENKLSSLEAEIQKMRVEMAGMKRDAEHYSRQEHIELEKRYRELTDLLYHKQTQLEAMASEKNAAEFQLEKEMKRLREVEAESNRVSRRASSTWEEDTELKTLEPLPLHHRHIAGARMQLQRAAKLLDSGAVTATRFLWRYPTARVTLLFYLVFVHLFLMYLLHRLQEQADKFASKELAASMGLITSELP